MDFIGNYQVSSEFEERMFANYILYSKNNSHDKQIHQFLWHLVPVVENLEMQQKFPEYFARNLQVT